MTSAEIRQSFLDFFRDKKQHTIVPSASLLPQSPGLLFTNAGMNQFVPYFLGTEKAPYDPARAADTQKCIRAGGKHNDLEDVGQDTYHHTFFEMLGNWSFGDYFKEEAITWAWELLTDVWGFPADRLYATVYAPNKEAGDPGEFDQEAYDFWAKLFEAKGLDPKIHIVNGNVKDNFWMMGETGPCGPCSELHMDLTPAGDTKGSLVNADSDQCIELWNLVFIQYNAEADGSFRDLPAKHIDTGMGFERICSIIQGTDGMQDFAKKVSNYHTDVFQPLFDKLTALSGKAYVDVYPHHEGANADELKTAIAFRVIADHIRTLSFSIADGIQPGNNGRNYVLRRILRRAVRFGRNIGFTGETPFLSQLVDVLVENFATVFPEIKEKAEVVKATLDREEISFNRTLDRGLQLFENEALDAIIEAIDKKYTIVKPEEMTKQTPSVRYMSGGGEHTLTIRTVDKPFAEFKNEDILQGKWKEYLPNISPTFPADKAFELYDTFGFPIDLTALLCKENGIALNEEEVEQHMEQQRERARAAQKSTIVRALDIETSVVTEFVGYQSTSVKTTVLEVHEEENGWIVITKETPFFAESGGQIADQGYLKLYGESPIVQDIIKIGEARGHFINKSNYAFMSPCDEFPEGMQSLVGQTVELSIDEDFRNKTSAHHSATHLLHWALHEVVSKEASQQGSSVTEDRLRFDFTSDALTAEQIAKLELAVNEKIASADFVGYNEVPYVDVKGREDIMQFFGDKYGEEVRVVQIGGENQGLNGYAMELCGGTHVKNTSEIGFFKIKSEGAIASGVRRIEAACGCSALSYITELSHGLTANADEAKSKLEEANAKLASVEAEAVQAPSYDASLASSVSNMSDINEINQAIDVLEAQVNDIKNAAAEADKKYKKAQAAAAARIADEAVSELLASGSSKLVQSFEGSANLLQELFNGLKKQGFDGVAFFAVNDGSKVHFGAFVTKAHQGDYQAGKLVQELGTIVGGRGGGKPEMARGAGDQLDQIEALITAAQEKLG